MQLRNHANPFAQTFRHTSSSLYCIFRVEDFLDKLSAKQAQKIVWTLEVVESLPHPPKQYFKKLRGTELWEIRTEFGGNAFRLLGFLDGDSIVVLTSGFAKKTQKTPQQEIQTATKRMKDYFSRKG